MKRRGNHWLIFGARVPGEALFAFVGVGLGCAMIALAAAALGGL